MKIADLILEESRRYQAFYKTEPDHVFIGSKQAAEIDAMVAEMEKCGLMVKGAPIPRAVIHGMQVFRVDAESHLSFGNEQPSPCG